MYFFPAFKTLTQIISFIFFLHNFDTLHIIGVKTIRTYSYAIFINFITRMDLYFRINNFLLFVPKQ